MSEYKGSATLFGGDDILVNYDAQGAFSGDPMSDPSLRDYVAMEPAFGPQNMPNSMSPKPGGPALGAKAINKPSNYKLQPSTPVAGITNTYSPFAGMYRGPQLSYSGSGSSSSSEAES